MYRYTAYISSRIYVVYRPPPLFTEATLHHRVTLLFFVVGSEIGPGPRSRAPGPYTAWCCTAGCLLRLWSLPWWEDCTTSIPTLLYSVKMSCPRVALRVPGQAWSGGTGPGFCSSTLRKHMLTLIKCRAGHIFSLPNWGSNNVIFIYKTPQNSAWSAFQE